jgi:16S rRNA (uracil1498-N3)-methyltransferase
MRLPRIHSAQPLAPGIKTELNAQAAHRLLQVLRLKPGRELVLFNGDGRDYQAVLVATAKRSAKVEITGQTDLEPLPPLTIHLGLGISKSERMDFAVQKAVELGTSSITPLITEHCVVRIAAQRLNNRLSHWRKVITASCEQSGRRRLPELREVSMLQSWLDQHNGGVGILLDPRAGRTLPQLSAPGPQIAVLSGPEGGLTRGECELALQTGFRSVRLGPRVMRTETAPLAAIAAIQTLWGDFR